MLIPKILHQIWINRDRPELPEEYCIYRDSWLEKNPEWEYRLWNLDNLDFEPLCAPLLDQAQHYAQMADLLRMEILYRHGGVYIDVDFECLRPITALLENVTAFGCSEDGRYVSTGILGGVKHASVFGGVLDNFPSRLGLSPVNIETGPVFFTRVLLTSGFSGDFTLFPTRHFYPFNYWTPAQSRGDFGDSYAVHHYADSWKTTEPAWRRVLLKVPRALRTTMRGRN